MLARLSPPQRAEVLTRLLQDEEFAWRIAYDDAKQDRARRDEETARWLAKEEEEERRLRQRDEELALKLQRDEEKRIQEERDANLARKLAVEEKQFIEEEEEDTSRRLEQLSVSPRTSITYPQHLQNTINPHTLHIHNNYCRCNKTNSWNSNHILFFVLFFFGLKCLFL